MFQRIARGENLRESMVASLKDQRLLRRFPFNPAECQASGCRCRDIDLPCQRIHSVQCTEISRKKDPAFSASTAGICRCFLQQTVTTNAKGRWLS